MAEISLVIHNVRSAHNVGSLFRTADGLGVEKIYLTGYTPYPEARADERPPHERRAATRKIHKTALGAESFVDWSYRDDVFEVLQQLSAEGYQIAALEQTPKSIELASYQPSSKLVLVVGSEIGGIEIKIIEKADVCLQIPMAGSKESFNVAAAAAIALYHLRYRHKSN